MRNIASNPYGAAKYFHFIIGAMLDHLFGVCVVGSHVQSEMGVLGEISAYFGTVESQGHSTLHLHMLIWLKNAPTMPQLHKMLKSEEFRVKVHKFICHNICAYVLGMEDGAAVKAILKDSEIACSQPVDPHQPRAAYEEQLGQFEQALARAEQDHICKDHCCLMWIKRGQKVCKRKAPWPCSNDDKVSETGEWACKHLYQFMNLWNLAVLLNLRCNNDIKLLMNGEDTKNITFYVTTYVAKKQSCSFNLMVLLADGYTFHTTHPNPKYLEDIRKNNRLLLFYLLNHINHEQELAAPMVVSYLMGWGNTYTSHTFSLIYWTQFA